MSTDYGTDLSCTTDLTFDLVSGPRVVLEALVRRITTRRGGLFYAPGYGTDVRDLLLARLDQASLYRWKAALEQECLQDDRVLSAAVDLTFNQDTQSMAIELRVELVGGEAAGVDLVTRSSPSAASGTAVSSGTASDEVAVFDTVFLY